MEKIGSRIIRLRIERNIRRSELAKLIGISEHTLWEIESNISNIKMGKCFTVAKQLNVNIRLLFFDQPYTPENELAELQNKWEESEIKIVMLNNKIAELNQKISELLSKKR